MRLVRLLVPLLLVALFAVPLHAAEADVTKYPACKYCSMDRDKFAHSRMLLVYEDGTEVATCSLHCAAVDLSNNIDRTPQLILVGDYANKNLIDAEKASWVMGGSKQGVMSSRAKWAFADRKAAEAFVAANGGSVVGFEQAMKGAYEDMYDDTRAIRERRKLKKMKMMEEKKAQPSPPAAPN